MTKGPQTKMNIFPSSVILLTFMLTARVGNLNQVQDLPTFMPVELRRDTFTYFHSYGATEIKGIQFIESQTQRKDFGNKIVNRTQVVVALNAIKVPVRFLEITEDYSQRHQISFLPNIGFSSELRKTRIGRSPDGVLAIPQYKGANVQEIKDLSSIKPMQIFGDEYLRSAVYDSKLLVLTTSSIKLLDSKDNSKAPSVLADAKVLSSEKLEDVSLEFVEDYDCIIQIGKRINSSEYVVQLFELKSALGKVVLNRKHRISLPVEILRAKPLSKDLSRLITSTEKQVTEFRWDRTDSVSRHPIRLQTVDGKQLTGINHILVDDTFVLFGTDTGVYFSSIWDDSESVITVNKLPSSRSAKVSQLSISKSDYLVVGYKISDKNNELIAAWKLNR